MSIRSENRGFTLIEIIVSISIFTVVMLVTMGSLLTLNDSSHKAQALRTVIDNLNFAVEDMNRKIRTGNNYHCYVNNEPVISGPELKTPKDCIGSNPGTAISLRIQKTNGAPVWVVYMFKKDPITGIGGIKFLRSLSQGGASDGTSLATEEEAITSPEVDIRKMDFRVVGATKQEGGPQTQPMVILNISGVVNLQKEKLRTDFSLQTAISKREGE